MNWRLMATMVAAGMMLVASPVLAADDSCVDVCGDQAPGDTGCWCDESCFDFGDCCTDICEACPEYVGVFEQCTDLTNCDDGNCDAAVGENCENCAADCGCEDPTVCFDGECCTPDCTDKECGDDGCGGDCGDCGPGMICGDDFACMDIPLCETGVVVECDDVVQDDTTGYENLLDEYNCIPWDESGPEVGFMFVPEVDDLVSVVVDYGDENDQDIMITEGDCSAYTCIDYGDSSAEFEVLAGETYYFVVEGYSGAAGPFTLTVKCQSTCVPECDGKDCGPDGCNGECGECADGEYCSEAGLCGPNDGCIGTGVPGCGGCACEACVCALDSYCCETAWDGICVSECQEDCGGCGPACDPACGDGFKCEAGECVECTADCDGKACGSDGCSGTCGECEGGAQCIDGQCVDTMSCVGACGGSAPGGCYCDESCFGFGDCCADMCAACPEIGILFPEACPELTVCDPPCTDGQVCNLGTCCTPTCDPTWECGDDGCGGGCGDCGAGYACTDNVCVEFTGLEQCLGLNEPSAAGCDLVESYEGCCDEMGRVIWCDAGSTFCIDCAGANPECGWQGEFYDCGTDGSGDPSGNNPKECAGGPSCDPPCGPGEACVDGVCEVCEPDCAGKQCGPDGCGGQCGACPGECIESICHAGPGCQVEEGPGCAGCGCEACVCEADAFCCDTQWDDLCVGQCINDCGGCPMADECGDGLCTGDEDCSTCLDDCPCGEGEVCVDGMCEECVPYCDPDAECGDDGCGGSCGECAEGLACVDGVCEAGSCVGFCDLAGEPTPAGCYCDAECFEFDDCCEDICDACPATEGCCTPDCTDKVCGDDGCDGSCGDCAEGEECVAGLCELPIDECIAACAGLDCGMVEECECGTCEEGFVCDANMCVEDVVTPTDTTGEEDVAAEEDTTQDTAGEEPTGKKKKDGCSTSDSGNPFAVVLFLATVLGLAVIRRSGTVRV